MPDIATRALDDAALRRLVAERQRFIDAVTSVVCEMLPEYGSVITSTDFKSHSEKVIQLQGFEGFSFWSSGSFNMFGSQEFKIWHERLSIVIAHRPVLHVKWWHNRGTVVEVFHEPADDWQKDLRTIVHGRSGLRAAYAEGERLWDGEKLGSAETEKAARRLRLV